MQVLMIANSKGGVGKSTLASNLVGMALEMGLTPLMVDLDRQRSLSNWAARHGDLVPCLLELPKNRRGLAKFGKPQVVIIDTPAGLRGGALDTALTVSDMVVVPTGAALVELEATRKFIQRLRRKKKLINGRADVLTVLNKIRPSATVADVMAEAEGQLNAPVAAWLPNAKTFEDQMAAGGFALQGRYGNMDLVTENLRRTLEYTGVRLPA